MPALDRSLQSGYFEKTTLLRDAKVATEPIQFFDSNTGKLLFTAPKGRTMDQFLEESRAHGWPSFRGKMSRMFLLRLLSIRCR